MLLSVKISPQSEKMYFEVAISIQHLIKYTNSPVLPAVTRLKLNIDLSATAQR